MDTHKHVWMGPLTRHSHARICLPVCLLLAIDSLWPKHTHTHAMHIRALFRVRPIRWLGLAYGSRTFCLPLPSILIINAIQFVFNTCDGYNNSVLQRILSSIKSSRVFKIEQAVCVYLPIVRPRPSDPTAKSGVCLCVPYVVSVALTRSLCIISRQIISPDSVHNYCSRSTSTIASERNLSLTQFVDRIKFEYQINLSFDRESGKTKLVDDKYKNNK